MITANNLQYRKDSYNMLLVDKNTKRRKKILDVKKYKNTYSKYFACSLYGNFIYKTIRYLRTFDMEKYKIFKENMFFLRELTAKTEERISKEGDTSVGVAIYIDNALEKIKENQQLIRIARKEHKKLKSQVWMRCLSMTFVIIVIISGVLTILFENGKFSFSSTLSNFLLTFCATVTIITPMLIDGLGNIQSYKSAEKPKIKKILRSSSELIRYKFFFEELKLRATQVNIQGDSGKSISILRSNSFKNESIRRALDRVSVFSTKAQISNRCIEEHNKDVMETQKKEEKKEDPLVTDNDTTIIMNDMTKETKETSFANQRKKSRILTKTISTLTNNAPQNHSGPTDTMTIKT